MSPADRGVCRWCHQPILWLGFAKPGERLAPIDPEPVFGGNVLVDLDLGVYEIVGNRERREELEAQNGPVLHRNHWQTCPQAEARRIRKRRAATVGAL